MQNKSANGRGLIASGGTNVIEEIEAENNDDESYYLSSSPVRKPAQATISQNPVINRGNLGRAVGALSTNGSNFGADTTNMPSN